MRLRILSSTLFAAAISFVAPAIAGATSIHTYVSGLGNDSSGCGRAAPCATFNYAYSQTTAGGEITVLDPGDYGSLTISHALTIRAKPTEGVIYVQTSANAIYVGAGPTDTVVLDGLTLDGAGGSSDNGNGIVITSGQFTYILNCSIQNFNNGGYGVNMQSFTPGARVFIRNSTILRNYGGVIVSNSNVMSVENTLIDGNANAGAQVSGSGTILGVFNSVINASPTALSTTSGATAASIGPSNAVSGAGGFTVSIPFK